MPKSPSWPLFTRWHFYTAPKGWKPSATEELEREDQLTTAPTMSLHPEMKSAHLAMRFMDMSNKASKGRKGGNGGKRGKGH